MKIAFTYTDAQGQISNREGEVVAMGSTSDGKLFARIMDGDVPKTFRLDRMRSVVTTVGDEVEPATPPASDLRREADGINVKLATIRSEMEDLNGEIYQLARTAERLVVKLEDYRASAPAPAVDFSYEWLKWVHGKLGMTTGKDTYTIYDALDKAMGNFNTSETAVVPTYLPPKETK